METLDRTLTTYSYAPRPIRFLGARSLGEWRIKGYAVAGTGEFPPAAAVEAGWRLAAEMLPRPALAEERHGVGFLTVHAGRRSLHVLLNWWAHGDVLKHRPFRAPADAPEALRCAAGEHDGPSVWELAVQAYEREAWMHHVLDAAGAPDLEAYLADGLSARI